MRPSIAICSALLIFATLSIAGEACAQSTPPAPTLPIYPFPDVYYPHWAYDGVGIVHAAGIMIGYPDGSFTGGLLPHGSWEYQAVDTVLKAGIVIYNPALDNDIYGYNGQIWYTRDQMASAVVRLLPLFEQNKTTNRELASLRKEFANRLQNNEAALDALISLIDELQPEFKQMGVDTSVARAHLAALRRPDGISLETAPQHKGAPAQPNNEGHK